MSALYRSNKYMKKLKFTRRKRLSNQLDYLLRYMISLSGLYGYDKIKKIEINKDILKIILPTPEIQEMSEIKENKKIGVLYGINLMPTDKMKIEIKQQKTT